MGRKEEKKKGMYSKDITGENEGVESWWEKTVT